MVKQTLRNFFVRPSLKFINYPNPKKFNNIDSLIKSIYDDPEGFYHIDFNRVLPKNFLSDDSPDKHSILYSNFTFDISPGSQTGVKSKNSVKNFAEFFFDKYIKLNNDSIVNFNIITHDSKQLYLPVNFIRTFRLIEYINVGLLPNNKNIFDFLKKVKKSEGKDVDFFAIPSLYSNLNVDFNVDIKSDSDPFHSWYLMKINESFYNKSRINLFSHSPYYIMDPKSNLALISKLYFLNDDSLKNISPVLEPTDFGVKLYNTLFLRTRKKDSLLTFMEINYLVMRAVKLFGREAVFKRYDFNSKHYGFEFYAKKQKKLYDSKDYFNPKRD